MSVVRGREIQKGTEILTHPRIQDITKLIYNKTSKKIDRFELSEIIEIYKNLTSE